MYTSLNKMTQYPAESFAPGQKEMSPITPNDRSYVEEPDGSPLAKRLKPSDQDDKDEIVLRFNEAFDFFWNNSNFMIHFENIELNGVDSCMVSIK